MLYFGEPRGALELLKRGVPLCGLVHGRKGGEGYRHLLSALTSLAEERGAPLPRWRKPNLSDPELIEQFKALKPDLIISGFYPRAISAEVLALAPGYNVHPSDLPKWRGPDPAYWVLRSGETRTAICVHQLTPALDEGAIAHRVEVQVRSRESGGALALRLERQAARVIADFTADLYKRAESEGIHVAELPLTLTPQEGEASWAPLVSPDEVEIDWSAPAQEVDQLVRASSPDPGAFSALDTGFQPELLVVYRGRPHFDERLESAPVGAPIIIKGQCYIKCGVGVYRLDRVKVGRKEMSGARLAELLS